MALWPRSPRRYAGLLFAFASSVQRPTTTENVETQRIGRISAGIPCRNQIIATSGEHFWFDHRLNESGITNFGRERSPIPVNGGARKEALALNLQDEIFGEYLG